MTKKSERHILGEGRVNELEARGVDPQTIAELRAKGILPPPPDLAWVNRFPKEAHSAANNVLDAVAELNSQLSGQSVVLTIRGANKR